MIRVPWDQGCFDKRCKFYCKPCFSFDPCLALLRENWMDNNGIKFCSMGKNKKNSLRTFFAQSAKSFFTVLINFKDRKSCASKKSRCWVQLQWRREHSPFPKCESITSLFGLFGATEQKEPWCLKEIGDKANVMLFLDVLTRTPRVGPQKLC